MNLFRDARMWLLGWCGLNAAFFASHANEGPEWAYALAESVLAVALAVDLVARPRTDASVATFPWLFPVASATGLYLLWMASTLD